MQFVDEVVIHVASGAGGAGHMSFRREKFVPKGGPSGGDGGRGGAVILEATARRNTLVDYYRKRHWLAPNGERGGRAQMTGASGEDLVCSVPIGTLVFDAETDDLLADLQKEGERWVLPGGRGGLGNIHFKSSTHQTPRKTTEGVPGTERTLRLELKLLADIGLLGYPNAGKSTLLGKISAANPRVADYPFTTLVPQLGVVLDDERERPALLIADIPGLIEGAAEGAGLGHRFLKHVERCAGFIHLVSASSWEGSPRERFENLNQELRAYGSDLTSRPQIVVLSKADLLDADTLSEQVRELERASGARVIALSSHTGQGVRSLLNAAYALLDSVRATHATSQPDQPAPLANRSVSIEDEP